MNTIRSMMMGISMLVALITVPVTALAEFSNTIDLDLVGLWHMDGDWKDTSVVGADGIPNNGVSFSTSAKVGTSAGSFDGINDFVSMANSDLLNQSATEAISIELWSKSNIDWSLHNEWTALIHKQNSSQSGFAMHIHRDYPAVFFEIITDYGDYAVFSNSLVKNQWYHFVGTYDGSSVKLYQDGILVQNANASGRIKPNSLNLEIGRWRNNYGEYFNGFIDDVRIYKRALSGAEVQEHYRNYVVNFPTVNPVPSLISTPIITLSGTKPANTSIAVNGTTQVPLDGMTSWQTSFSLSPGMNSISVYAQDNQNFTSLPVTLTVFLDAMPPQVTTTAPANSGILNTAPDVITFTLADSLSPLDLSATLTGATVTNAAGVTVPGTWSSFGSSTTGTVTFTPAAALGEGQYRATIKPTDALANSVMYTLTFTIDGTPPVAPGIDPVAPLNSINITLTGTRSSDSASVAVSCAGAAIGTVSYPTATTWSVNVSGLLEGRNSIAASAVDQAGNRSTAATATIIVDTTAPVVGATPVGGIYKTTQLVALVASEQTDIYYTMDGSTPTDRATIYSQPISIPASATLKYFGRDLAGNTGEIMTETYVIDMTPPLLAISTLNDAAYTNNETLNIAGTVTDNSGVKGLTVNDSAVTINADGSFSHALLLQKGVNIITIAATDSAANLAVDTRAVTLDQTAPVLEVTTPADNSNTAGMLLEMSGTVDETSAVTVKIRDTVQPALINSGTFTATIPLEPGYNTIEITATDLAGNRSAVKRTVVFDDQSPSLAVTGPSQDIRTNQNTLTITGTVADPLTAVGVTISMNNEIFTPPVIDGTFEQAVSFAEEKTYGIVVTATDEVGTSASVQRNVIYDITPPLLSIDPITSPTSRPSMPVSGTREAGAAVTVTSSTAAVGEVSYPTATTWQVDIANLREGENVITATSADAAGNAVTATATIVLASRLPEIRIKATPDVIWPPNHHMVPVTITGGVETFGTVIKSVSISLRDEYGKIKYNNLTFGSTVMLEAWRLGNDRDGRKYTITVAVTDKGGATTTKTATVTVPHDNSFQSGVSGRLRGMRW